MRDRTRGTKDTVPPCLMSNVRSVEASRCRYHNASGRNGSWQRSDQVPSHDGPCRARTDIPLRLDGASLILEPKGLGGISNDELPIGSSRESTRNAAVAKQVTFSCKWRDKATGSKTLRLHISGRCQLGGAISR
jgi:hypothetical protein